MRQFYLLFLSISLVFFGFFFKSLPSDSAATNYEKSVSASVVKNTPPKKKRPLVLKNIDPENQNSNLFAPTITAVKSFVFNGGQGPGAQIDYTILLSNSGTDATGVVFTDVLNSNLTLVPGSVKASPIAVDDAYQCLGNVGISVPAANGVLANDINPVATPLGATTINTAGTQGAVSMNPDGSFTFVPNVGFSGTTTFTYTVSNTQFARTATVTITVSTPIWFVNIGGSPGGSGTISSPFKDWSEFATANGTANGPAANQVIFVYSGTYNGAATLLSGQKVLGQGATTSLASFAGVTVPSHTFPLLPSTGLSKPNITSSATTITLNNNNTLQGFDLGNSTKDIVGSNFGTLTTSEMSLTGTGAALDLTTGTLACTFTDISASTSTNTAIKAITVGGSLTNTTGTISATNNLAINITGTNSSNKVSLGLTFVSVSSSGAANGLNIQNTSGSLSINGNGSTAGSGGTIQNTTSNGIYLLNANAVSVNYMNITNTDKSCISATNLSGTCAINNSTLSLGANSLNVPTTPATTSYDRRCVHILNENVTLTLNVNNSTFNGQLTTSPNDNHGIAYETTTASTTSTIGTLNIKGSSFNKFNNYALYVTSTGAAVTDVGIQTSTVDFDPANGGFVGGAIHLWNLRSAKLKFNILNNSSLKTFGGLPVDIYANNFDASTDFPLPSGKSLEGKMIGNTMSGNSGMQVLVRGKAQGVVQISNNILNNGMVTLQAVENTANATAENARLDAIVTGNIMPEKASAYGIDVISGGSSTSAFSNIVNCVKISGNNVTPRDPSGLGIIRFRTNGNSDGDGFNVIWLERVDGSETGLADYWNKNNINSPLPVGTDVQSLSPNRVTNSGFGGIGNKLFKVAGTCIAPSNAAPARMATPDYATSEVISENLVKEPAISETEEIENALVETKTNELETTPLQNTVNSNAKLLSGETVTVDGTGSGFTLPAGKNTTITFSATISSSPTTCSITNQASVSGSNFTTITSNTTTSTLIVPAPTGVTGASSICNGKSISLSANCSTGTVQWYNAAATGTLLGTGSTFSQSPTSNTTYQAACLVGGCESARTNSGLITVNPIPNPNPNSNSPVCSGKTLNLTSASSSTYNWSGPNSFSSSLQNPSISNVTIAGSGVYTITQTNSFGCTTTSTVNVTINQSPTVSAGSNTPICSGQTINLTSSANDNYVWTGPNSFSSSLQNPSINNAGTTASGTYTLTVTNALGCTATTTTAVVVNALPSPSATSNSPICEGKTLNLTGSGTGTYFWNGPNSFTSSTQSPSINNVSVAASGIYTFTVTNVSGCSATSTTSVIINALPVPNPMSNSPINIGGTLNLSSTGGGTYAWAGPNSFTSSLQNPSINSITTASAGTYTVIVTNSGCSATATTTVIVNEATASSNSPICEGGILNLNGAGGVSYAWSGPNSFSSSLQNPSFTNATSTLNGIYTVTVTASGGGTATATTSVTVNPVPIPNPISNSPICVGSTLNLTSASSTSYAWSGPNSFSSSLQNPSISNASTASGGIYTITQTNSFNCSVSSTLNVVVNANATATATPDAQTICSGETITSIVISGTGTSYTWTRDNTTAVTGIAASGTGDITGGLTNTTDAPVTVTFTITPIGTCNGTPITATVVVNPIPTATASVPSQSICSGTSIGAIVFTSPISIASSATDLDNATPAPQVASQSVPEIVLGASVVGTVFNWTRDNVATVTGSIAASGTGNIAGTLTNTTALPITVTFTVTPSYTNAGTTCTGTPITVTVTVNPRPNTTITNNSTVVCGGSSTTISVPAEPNNTYAWQRSLTGLTNPNSFTAFGGTTNTQEVTSSGIYQVTVNNQYNCSAVSSPTIVKVADYVFNGTLAAGDAQQTGRMNRFAVASTCAAPTTFQGYFTTAGARYYDSYTITNPRNVPVCATIGYTSSCGSAIFSAAYLGSFNPTSLGTNYLADHGSSFVGTAFYEATIPANGTIVVVVHEVNPGTGCADYTLYVDLPHETSGITVNPSSPLCTPTPVTLQASLADSYLWNPGGATTQSINPTPTATTTYGVTLGYGNNGCTTTATTEIVVGSLTATPNSQTICSGESITTIAISGGGTSYSWTRDNTTAVTGIPSSGTGDISGVLTNTTNAPVTVTYTITQVGGACNGITTTATVVVNPIPTAVASTPSQNVCSGVNITGITFSSPSQIQPTTPDPSSDVIPQIKVETTRGIVFSSTVAGTVFNWTRDNVGTVGGSIPASGTGNIVGNFINTTSSPITVTFTITPSYTNAGKTCTGTPIMVTVTVNPNPASATITDTGTAICSGSSTTLSAPANPNYTYAWERSITGIANPNSFTSFGGTAQTQVITTSGVYRVIVTNQYNCSASDTTAVKVGDFVFNGSLTIGDAQQTGRMNRFATVSTCAAPKTYPGNFTTTGSRYYDSYTITNPTSAPICATVGLSSYCGTSIFTAAYLGSFNPTNLATNYLADHGSSFPGTSFYEVTIPANGTIVVVVHEVNPGTGCGAYNLRVDVPGATVVPTASSNSPICEGSTLNLSSTGTGTYSWTGPNSFTSSVQNPSIANASTLATGTYTVTVTNTNGCVFNATTAVTVNANPTATASSNSPVCVGNTLNLSSGTASAYSWTGPNSFSSTIQNPSILNVTNASNGTYTLVASTSGCSTTSTTSVTINALPLPNPTSDSPKCVGTTLTFNSATGMTTYAWTGPNSFSSSLQNPSISNVTAGANGTYTLTVVNSNGCSASATTSVTINALPIPNPTSNSPRCVGTTLSLSSVTGMTTYAWAGPNSFTSALQSPNISNVTQASSGTYTLTVTNANGCSASATTAVVINTLPVPNPSSDSPKCVGATLNLSAVSGMSLYAWSGPNSFSSSLQNPSISNVTSASNGTYTLTVTNASGCSASATTGVVINALPVPNPLSDSPKCVGTTLSLSSVGGMTNYAWSGPNAFVSTLQNPSINNVQLSAGGTYTISVTNSNSCVGTGTVSVVINPLPSPIIGSNSPICEGGTLNLTSSSSTTYAWTGPNAFTSASQNPTLSNAGVLASGKYKVVQTTAFGCTASATTNVVINPTPVIGTTVSSSAICVGNSVSLSANCNVYTVKANLTGNQQVPSVVTSGTGSSIGTYNALTNQLTLATSFEGLGSNATMAHIHSGAVGVNGGVLVMFSGVPTETGGNFGYSGNISSFASDLLAGNTYVNIHTTTNSGGEIRGQLSAVCASNNYVWSPGNISGQTITVSPSTTTVYTVTASNTSTGCSTTASTSITVNSLPVPIVSSNSPICSGLTLNLSASGGSTYAWTGPNSFASTAQNPSISNATVGISGVYSVTITNSNGCTATATTSVTIFNLPNPTIGSNSPLCEGATLNLTAENGGTMYDWSGPNGFKSGSQNPSIGTTLLANAGVYSITITNASGCTATATTLVVINPLNVSATNTGPYTTNQTIQLIGTGGNIYSWVGPNGFTATGGVVNRPNATLNMAGIYTATITNGPCSNTATTNVVITGIDPCVQVLEYTYVQAGNPYQALFPISNGMSIAQSANPTSILVHPICNSITIESVEMNLQGPDGLNWNILQNVEPFALFDNSAQNVFGRTLAPGNYSLTVTGYSLDNKGGTQTYGPIVTNFTIVGNMSTISMPTYSGVEFCAGTTVPVTFTTTGTFGVGNTFSVQLSDGNGDFTNPVVIGTSTTAGVVNCTIPLSAADGQNYRIRVASSNAIYTNMNPSAVTIHPFLQNLVSPTNDFATGTITKKAVQSIDATNKVNSPANTTYQAGKSIMLNPGFEAKSGATFTAKIQGCN